MIDSSYRTTQRSGDLFWYDYHKAVDVHSVNDTILLEREKITDVDNKSVLDFETAEVIHGCDICEATYNTTYGSCQVDDTRMAYHVSNNPSCSPDYNESVYCDYCVPDWEARTGGIYDCNSTNQRYSFYDDFADCYALTNLSSDSPPIDHDSVVSCSYYNTDMTCDYDSEPYLDKKINVVCNIPAEHSNETFECVSYVRTGLNTSNILQSNPEYQQKTTSFISLGSNDIEDRQYFESKAQIVHGYYTDKNIETDHTFVMGMKCTSGDTILVSEYPVTPTYKGLNSQVNRLVWVQNNVGFILIGFLGLIVLILFIAWIISKLRGN